MSTETPLPPLTPRTREIGGMVAQGLLNKQIAGRLGISENAVKKHVSQLLDAYVCANRTQLALAILKESAQCSQS